MHKLSYEERDRVREIRRQHLLSLQGEAESAAAAAAEASTPKVEQPKALDLDGARAEYKRLAGQVASPKWSLSSLNEKIETLEAEAAKEAEEDRLAAEKLVAEKAAAKAADEAEAAKGKEESK